MIRAKKIRARERKQLFRRRLGGGDGNWGTRLALAPKGIGNAVGFSRLSLLLDLCRLLRSYNRLPARSIRPSVLSSILCSQHLLRRSFVRSEVLVSIEQSLLLLLPLPLPSVAHSLYLSETFTASLSLNASSSQTIALAPMFSNSDGHLLCTACTAARFPSTREAYPSSVDATLLHFHLLTPERDNYRKAKNNEGDEARARASAARNGTVLPSSRSFIGNKISGFLLLPKKNGAVTALPLV